MPEPRRHHPSNLGDRELEAISTILGAFSIVPHGEARERVNRFVQERLPTLPYLAPNGEEVPPPPDEPPMVPLKDRTKPED